MEKDNIEAVLIGLEKTALYLGISENNLRTRVKRGEIPFMKIGNLYKFSKEALDKWIEEESGRNSNSNR